MTSYSERFFKEHISEKAESHIPSTLDKRGQTNVFMFNQRKNLLSVLILLIFVFLLEVVAFYESKILTRICDFPLLAPVITIIIVPALAFIIGIKCGEISKPEIRNNLFQDKNKLVRRILNVLIIIFCLTYFIKHAV